MKQMHLMSLKTHSKKKNIKEKHKSERNEIGLKNIKVK